MKNIIILFFVVLISCQSKSQDKLDFSVKNISHKEVDNETGWIRIKLNNPNKWGFINKDSLVMIPFEYDFLNPFENGLAYAKNKGKEFFITKRNLKLEGDFDAVNIFSEGLASAKKNDKWGFIDESGKLVISPKYDEVDYFRPSGLCAVKRNGVWGFIDKFGKEVIAIIYPEVNQQMKDQNVIVKKNNKWAIFDNLGRQLSDFIYDNVKRTDISDFSKDIFTRDQSTYFENGAALVEIDGKYEFINAKARAAFPNNKFDSASVFDTFKNAIVKRNGKYGIIKTDGTFKVPLEYDHIGYFDTNHAFSEYYNVRKGEIYSILNRDLKKIGESYEPVFNDFSNSDPTLTYKNLKGKVGIIDWQGKTLIPFEYDELTKIENEKLLIAIKNRKYGLIDESGHLKIPFIYNSLYSFDGSGDQILFIADEKKIINLKNRVVLDGYETIQPIYYNVKKIIVSKNKKFGVIDVNNKILLPLEYDEITNWVEYGPEERHFIMKNGQYGLVEFETFKIIIPPIYDKFMLRQNIIFASHKGKSGILDINNKEICPFVFDEIKPDKSFGYRDSNGKIFYSKKGNKFFEITLKGKIIKEISQKEYKNNTEYQNM